MVKYGEYGDLSTIWLIVVNDMVFYGVVIVVCGSGVNIVFWYKYSVIF